MDMKIIKKARAIKVVMNIVRRFCGGAAFCWSIGSVPRLYRPMYRLHNSLLNQWRNCLAQIPVEQWSAI